MQSILAVSSKVMNPEPDDNRLLNELELFFFEQQALTQFQPYVTIVEQPAERSLRFRYFSEGKWAGSIRGVNYTPLKRSYPTIQVIGYRGKAWVEVSCVLDDYPYKQHPHELVGKEGCVNGVCKLPIPEETMSLSFSNLGIHCVKKDEIQKSLSKRKALDVDPFKGGFSHATQVTPNHLKSVRLCFQVYLEVNGNKIRLDPIVSNPIKNQKKPNKLVIVKLSHCVCLASGSNYEIMIFCEKIDKDDIQIRFYKESNGLLVWEDFGSFTEKDIHKEVGISFKAPSYIDEYITTPVEVFVQLRRPSDGTCSEGLRFEYHPSSTNFASPRKRAKRYRRDELLDVLEEYQGTSNLSSPPLPSFSETWAPLNRSTGFLNANNVGQVNLMDSDIREESQSLTQDILIPNSFSQVLFNNFSISNNGIISNPVLPVETSHGQEYNWRLNIGSG